MNIKGMSMKIMADHTPIEKSRNHICFSKEIIFFLVVLFSFPIISLANLSLNTDISISATVFDNGQGNVNIAPLGSGGVLVDPNLYILQTDITFSGIAYPRAKIFLLLNGLEMAETKAGSDALFSLKLSNLTSGVKVFSAVAEDIKGLRSILVTLPITVKASTSTVVSNLFIPPTLSIDKKSYGKGEDISVSGYSAPKSTILLNIDSQNNTTTSTDNLGLYNFAIKTDSFFLGNHNIQAKARIIADTKIKTSGLGQLTSFFIALNKEEKIKDKSQISLVADINNDSVINIIDFSILASWYLKSNPPKNVDLDGTGKVTIRDFSILAYYWNA